MRRVAAALSLVGASAALAGCGAGAAEHVSLQVQPPAQRFDQPLRIAVGGLHPGQAVMIALRSTDASGVKWAATRTVHADSRGRATAGVGLLWAMQPVSATTEEFFTWGPASVSPPFTASARVNGAPAVSARFTRRLWPPPTVTTRVVRLASAGFAGELFAPAGPTKRPAVLVIGGSSGGLPAFQAETLASAGYPALALAYFGYPGLPTKLLRIPLEYFARAGRWLARQPGVDPAHLVALGISRGSEAALLLGVHYPPLFHAVIGMVPSDAAVCSFPGCTGPAWTLHGRPLPYTRNPGNPAVNPAAFFAVEKIRGPILLACGDDDTVWDSCGYSQTMISRVNAHHDRYAHLLYAYPAAGHYVGSFIPDVPETASSDPTVAVDEPDRVALWSHLLAFLASL